MKKQIKGLTELASFEVLNQKAMNVIVGGVLLAETTSSDKKDVDSEKQDSYRDDKSEALEPSFDF